MDSKALGIELAGRAGIPEYQARQILTHISQIVLWETKKGGSVRLPGLGDFRGGIMGPKTIKTLLLGELGPDGKPARYSRTFPARRKLKFTPIDSKKWL